MNVQPQCTLVIQQDYKYNGYIYLDLDLCLILKYYLPYRKNSLS